MFSERDLALGAATRQGRWRVWVSAAAVIVIAVVALWARVVNLGARPMHTDEAVHAAKFGELLQTGGYRYDAAEYHGPILYYFNLPVAWLRGQRTLAELDEVTLRLVPAIFGTLLVLLCILASDGLGRGGAAWAAGFVAASPGLLYYSRYYIQEIPFVFFAFLLVGSGWRFSRRPSLGWALVAGTSAGLMVASKETCVINWFGMGVALLLTVGPRRLLRAPWGLLFIGAACALLVAVCWLTGFFTHPGALVDAAAGWAPYGQRVSGEGHQKTWSWYFEILFRGWRGGRVGPEVAMLTMVGVAVVRLAYRACRHHRPLVVFLAIYAAVMLAVYCVIPYKTPWLLMSSLHAAAVLAGAGVAELLRVLKRFHCGPVAVLVGALALWQTGRAASLACGRLAEDQSNPYVYSHTTRDLVRFVGNIRDAAAHHPDGRAVTVKVMSPEYWPLPWYLRDFPNVGYWSGIADDPEAPIIVTTPELGDALRPRLKGQYAMDFGGLRHGYLLVAFIRQDLWDAMVAARSVGPVR
ncbi:MAG TPA: TIGR03663 family protein [Verrucomicrobiae bacterium]|nr:TIGR03663 family protein [Verrucomicrobiae bacterium]